MAQENPYAQFRDTAQPVPVAQIAPAQLRPILTNPAQAQTQARLDQSAETDVAKSTFRTMTAEEAAKQGLPAGGVYQINGLGEIKVIRSAGDVKPTPIEQAGNSANLLLASAGVKDGKDPVADLIKGSTSGSLQQYGAQALGAVTGQSTPGMEKIARLKTIVSDMTLAFTEGKLGAGVSNADVIFLKERVGNLADPSVPANERLAAWDEVKTRLQRLSGSTESGATPAEPAKELTGTGNFLTDRDRELQATLTDQWNKGASLEQLQAIAAEYGQRVNLGSQGDLDRAREQGRSIVVEPTGVRSQAGELIGGVADSPVGAFAVGATNALTSGTMDELAPLLGLDAGVVQSAKEMLRERYPVSSFAGEVTGSGLQMAGGGMALRGAGIGAKGLAGAEIAQGAAYGAGEANDNRLGGAMLGAGATVVGQKIGSALASRFAAPEVKAAIDQVAAESGAPREAVEQALTEAADMVPGSVRMGATAPAAEQVTEVIKIAETASGKGRTAEQAKQQLAQLARINPEAKAAAERLGIAVPLDVLSDDTRLLTATGLSRSQPASAAETEWLDVSKRVIGEADDTLAKIGATRDLGQVSLDVRTRLEANMNALEKAAIAPRAEVDEAINVRDLVEAPNMRQAIDDVIADFGGAEQAKISMTPEEKTLMTMLGTSGEPKPATYAALNRVRDQLGKAIFKNEGPWTTVDKATLKRYYGALAKDQLQYVESVGGKALADKMKLSNDNFTKMYQVRDAMQAVFGAQLEKDIGGLLRGAITKTGKGEGKDLRTIMKNVPKDMRSDALLSAIMAEAEKGAASPYGGFSFKGYANLYRSLRQNNSPAYAEIAKTIGLEKERILQDLYTLSTRMAAADAKIIRTGKANNPVLNALKAESLVGKIAKGSFQGGSRVAGGVAGGAVGGPLGAVAGQEAGARIADSLVNAGKNELDKLHTLLSSDGFRDLVEKVGTGEGVERAVNRVANDGPFRRFGQTALGLKTPEDRKNWLMRAIEVTPVVAGTQAMTTEQPTATIEVR